jgi:hypothetical protein
MFAASGTIIMANEAVSDAWRISCGLISSAFEPKMG